MVKWLLKDEPDFKSSKLLRSKYRKSISRTKATYSILLREIKIFNNKRIFRSANINVLIIVVDGYPDMKSGVPFWTQQLNFFGIKDGAILPIDPQNGFLIYQGKPNTFLNFYILVIHDKQISLEFVDKLKNNFITQKIGTVAGTAISIFSEFPGNLTMMLARALVVKSIEITFDYFLRKRNLVIGTYYGSLLEDNDFSLGFQPPEYPDSLLNCGDALGLGYEIRKRMED